MLLIITACVNPSSNMPNTTIRDKGIRFTQYLNSLVFFLNTESITDIIFCDNSNADADYSMVLAEAEKKGKRIEILKYMQETSKTISKGKSYGELCIMDYVLNNSKIIGEYDGFYKVTGRLIIKNIDSITRKIYQNIDNRFVFLGNPVKESSRKIDTRFYYMKSSDMKKLISKLYDIVDETKGFTLERSFYEEISELNIPFVFLPKYPEYIGVSGSTGVVYEDTRFRRIKLSIKDFLIYFYMIKNRGA